MQKQFRAAARLVVINDQDEVLIVKMWRYWAIPWGGIDYWENVPDCLTRESVEELGVKAEFEQILFIQDYLGDVKWEQMHCLEYFCSVKNNSDYKWVEESYKMAEYAHELQEVQFCKLEDFPDNFMPKALPWVLKKYIDERKSFSPEYVSTL